MLILKDFLARYTFKEGFQKIRKEVRTSSNTVMVRFAEELARICERSSEVSPEVCGSFLRGFRQDYGQKYGQGFGQALNWAKGMGRIVWAKCVGNRVWAEWIGQEVRKDVWAEVWEELLGKMVTFGRFA